MATLRQLVTNTAERLGKWDDEGFLEVLKFTWNYWRATFVRRDLERNIHLSPDYIQDLGCSILFEKVDKADCCEVTLGCDVFQTVDPLPQFIRLKTGPGITYVGGVDGLNPYRLIDLSRVPYIAHETYTKHLPAAYWFGRKLRLLNASPERLRIMGILFDPELAASYQCAGGACYTDDSEYPLPADMIQPITEGIINGELRLMYPAASPGKDGEVTNE